MNKPSSGIENDKNKENKETTETDSYEEYDNEGMENAEEAMEDQWPSDIGVSFNYGQSSKTGTETECETSEVSHKNSYAERRELLLREKWFTVTGKKPRNIPIVKADSDENSKKVEFFGDRKPTKVENSRSDKIKIAAKKMQALNIQYGKVRQEIQLSSLEQGLMCIKFSRDGNILAFSYRQGDVELRRTSTNKLICRLNTSEHDLKLPIRSLVFHPNDSERLYTGGDCGNIVVCDSKSGEIISSQEGFDVINVMDMNEDGSYIATGGREGRVYVVDANTLQQIWTRGCSDLSSTLDDEYHRMRIYGLKFHPTEINLFATGGWDNVVKIWDVRVPRAIRSICGPSIYGAGLDITDNILLTASWRAEHSLHIWDFHSGQLIKNIPIKNKSIKMEGEFLYSAKFFSNVPPYVSNSMIAVGGSGFPEMLIINIYTERVEKYFPSYKAILTLDIFQNLVAYGGKESILRIAEVLSPSGRSFLQN